MSAPGSGVDWRVVLGAIKEWYTTATGLQVAWARQPRRPQNAKPFGTLYMSGGPFQFGRDSVRRKYNPATGLIERKVTGDREFVIQCQAFSDSPEHDQHARIYIDAALAALWKPSVIKRLAAADAAAIDITDPVDLSELSGADWQSRCSMDVRFRTSSSVEDEPIAPIEGVDFHIRLHGTVKGPPIIIPDD